MLGRNISALLLRLAVLLLITAALSCGSKLPDPVPEDATPEEVVRLWFDVLQAQDHTRMPGLFDPDSPLYEQAKVAVIPSVSISKLMLETTTLAEREAEVIAEFNAVRERRSGTDTGEVTQFETHSRTRFTLVRKPDGKWRLTGIRPADEGTGAENLVP